MQYIVKLLFYNKITEFTSKSKLYNFCIIKINLMLRKRTLLQSVSMCCANIGSPNSKSSVTAYSWSANIWPTTVLQILKLNYKCWTTVGPMLARQQRRVVPTIAQRWPNDCMRSGGTPPLIKLRALIVLFKWR